MVIICTFSGAMAENEKKMHAGDDFPKSIRNVMDAQKYAYSRNFPKVKKLPGIVRLFQESPFKMFLANYDQSRLGAEYVNKTEDSFMCVDSSGKLFNDRQKKSQSKKLNTALVIPPIEKGQSPFPIFEMISETNKTIDFLGFFQYAWHYMGVAINNQPVKFPSVIITDISFANIHSILQFFNQMKIKDYLKLGFNSVINKAKIPVSTILTICESHLLPAILKTARGANADKVLADTVVAGVMVMLQARTFEIAYDVWKNLVTVHCSKRIDREAQNNVKATSYGNQEQVDDEDLFMFENDKEEPEEISMFGKREGIRENSPFLNLFMKVIDKIETAESNIEEISNPFFCPQLVKKLCKQYLSLFPLISSCVLGEGEGALRNNAYVELYWQELRRIFANIPKRILWPPQYLGTLHEEIQRKATEIITRKFIPNIRTGGKASEKAVSFIDKLDDDDFNIFQPTPAKKKKNEKQTKMKLNEKTLDPLSVDDKNIFKPRPVKTPKTTQPKESFNESFETWDSKVTRDDKKDKKTYLKGKVIDYRRIEEAGSIQPRKRIVVRGPGLAIGQFPQGIVISEERLAAILVKNVYIDNEVVDAGLSLIDRKLSEDCQYVEGVQLYNNTVLRLIHTGVHNLVKTGPFLAIFPRRFAVAEEGEQEEALARGEVREDLIIGHFTLISNIHCQADEVNVYETLPAYRTQSAILTSEQQKLLKVLTKCENKTLKINCVNVLPQTEAECGAISIGLAVKLCFSALEERAVFESFVDVRRDFAECLKLNDLVNFESRKVLSRLNKNDYLFSINI